MTRTRNFRAYALTCAILILALIAAAASAQPTRAPANEQPLDAAMAAYERNHWVAAYAAFSALADGGHPEAARIAMQMWRYGPALYGTSFTASASQLTSWSRLQSCNSDLAGVGCAHARRTP